MARMELLLTGATGYVGGSILSQILASSRPAIKDLSISVLVRRQAEADVLAAKGVRPILFKDLDESDVLRKAASEHDVVIHAASGFHPPSAVALIEGLGERKRATGKEVYYIHTSGTSNLGDHPVTKTFVESREFSDTEDVHAYEKIREAGEPYIQRTAELTAVETAERENVKIYVIMSPTIYGLGLGMFKTQSIQIPIAIKSAIETGYAAYIDDGAQLWDHVHIADMAALYETILDKVISEEGILPSRRGLYFTATGHHSWFEVAQGIAEAGAKLGALKSAEPRSVSLEEGAKLWSQGNLQIAELGFASRSVTNSVLGRKLGWMPQKTDEDWKATFLEEFKAILQETQTKA